MESLGHCGSCHTPRGIGFQEKALSFTDGDKFLAGGVIDGWFAKSLRGDKGYYRPTQDAARAIVSDWQQRHPGPDRYPQ